MPRHLALPLIVVYALLISNVCAQQFPLARDHTILSKALSYVAAHQNPDGGFGQFGESDLSTTSRVLEALVAAGENPLSYRVNGVGPAQYLGSVSEAVYAGQLGTNPLSEKINLLLSLVACGLNPREFGGRDHVESLLAEQDNPSGAFGLGPSDTAYAILALRAAGISADDARLRAAGQYLEQSQLATGGYEYMPGFGEDSNTVSVVVMALARIGSTGIVVDKAMSALPTFQNKTNGGFFYQSVWGTTPDVSSTAQAMQAIITTSGDPTATPWVVPNGSPFDYLLQTQNATTGEFYDKWGSLRPTALAIPAILGVVTPGVRIAEPTIIACFPILLICGRLANGK